jgi:hypothetical protein
MYWRTWKIVEGFASAQQRENPKVQAKPVAQGKPCVEFKIGQPIGFSKVHGISPVSYVRNVRENGVQLINTHTFHVKLQIKPFLVG